MKPSYQTETKWSWMKSLSLGVTALMMATSLVACSKGGGGGTAAAPAPVPVIPVGPGVPTCVGCPGNSTAFLASAVGKVMGGQEAEIGMEFFGDPSITSMNQQGSVYGLNQNYYGPFGGQGVLFIGYNMPYCNVPAGVYTLRTLQPGVWGNDGAGRSLEGIFLEATGGPTPIQVYMSGWITPSVSATVGRDGRQYPFTLSGTMQIKRTDMPANVYCQRDF